MDVLSNLTRTTGSALIDNQLLRLSTIASTYNDSAPANGTIVLSAKAAFGFTINELRGLGTSAGTLSVSVQINGTNVTGLTSISVTTTAQDVSATGANVVAVGDRVTLIIASVSGAAGLEFTLRGTR